MAIRPHDARAHARVLLSKLPTRVGCGLPTKGGLAQSSRFAPAAIACRPVAHSVGQQNRSVKSDVRGDLARYSKSQWRMMRRPPQELKAYRWLRDQ
jgi:hypothetical protein